MSRPRTSMSDVMQKQNEREAHLRALADLLEFTVEKTGDRFLNALLAKAQRACCPEVEVALSRSEADDFETAVLRMFQQEWELQHRTGGLKRIAIVDDRPAELYLYPEFLLAQRFFQKHGIDVIIADGRKLRHERSQLLSERQPVDLVY